MYVIKKIMVKYLLCGHMYRARILFFSPADTSIQIKDIDLVANIFLSVGITGSQILKYLFAFRVTGNKKDPCVKVKPFSMCLNAAT